MTNPHPHPHPLPEGAHITPWRYALGAVVTWAIDAPHEPPWTYRIVRRRYEDGAEDRRRVQYLLEPIAPQCRWASWWAYEVHVKPWEESHARPRSL